MLTGWLGLLFAGLGAGIVGSVAGLASLVSFPALLATGLSPVSANVTNTVALVFSTVGSVSGSRPELRPHVDVLRALVPVAVLGGAAGAAALLVTPGSAFEAMVPWLIGLASMSIVLHRRGTATDVPVDASPRWLPPAVFGVAIYGGYFGAAAGVLLLALFLRVERFSLPEANAAKNLLLGVANMIAAVAFAIVGDVHWWAVLPLGLGLLVGGRLGPAIVRRVPPAPLRVVIGSAGLVLAIVLAYRAYR